MLCSPIRLHHSRLASIASRSSCLIHELLLRKLSETVVIVGNAPYDRPRFFVVHLISNRASFLCTKPPMRRVQKIVSGHQLTSTSVPLAEEGPSHCWPGQVSRAGLVISSALPTLHSRVGPNPS